MNSPGATGSEITVTSGGGGDGTSARGTTLKVPAMNSLALSVTRMQAVSWQLAKASTQWVVDLIVCGLRWAVALPID